MYSSSTLEGPAKSGCWKQLDYSEKNADSLFPLEYRSYLGQAAHAVLQYCAERRTETEAEIRKTADEAGNLLISEGRIFRGREEPPMPAEDVWQGVDVAINYLLTHELPTEEASPLIPETEWVHPNLPYRALIDLVAVFEEGDEEYSCRVVELTDYKTSWQAGKNEINTLQRWGQAICVWRDDMLGMPNIENKERGIDIIRQRIVNLRTQAEYTRDIHLDDPDEVAELERWEARIASLCKRADEKPRAASPGVGCISCAYRHICPDTAVSENPLALTSDELAQELAIAVGQCNMLISALKAQDPEMHIEIPGGYVGYKEQVRRIFRSGSEKHILGDWFEYMASELPVDIAPTITSLLAALKLGKSNLDSLAKALHPEKTKGIREVRAEYVEGITIEKRYAQFGVWGDQNNESKQE